MSQQTETIKQAKYWVAVLYQENMIPDWKECIDEILQLPFAYCEHNKDLDKDGDCRKEHLHLIVAFPNTTTYNHAMNVFKSLSATGKDCLNTCKAIINIRFMYNYLIHDTDNCRKKKKFLYDASERILGNNFDIGAYEQVDLAEKNSICKELADMIVQNGIANFADLYIYVSEQCEDTIYFEVLKNNASFLGSICKGVFHKLQFTNF